MSPEGGQGGGKGASAFLALLVMGLGAWNLFAPQSIWKICYGWRFKDAQPSGLALGLYRAGGILLLFVGPALAFILCFMTAGRGKKNIQGQPRKCGCFFAG